MRCEAALVLTLVTCPGASTALAQPEQARQARGDEDPEGAGRYTVEVAVQPSLGDAKRTAEVVARELGPGVAVRVERRERDAVVRAGYFVSADAARPLLARTQEMGYEDASIAPLAAPRRQWRRSAPGSTGDGGSETVRKRFPAARIAGREPRIDGRLDDEAWRSATFTTDFMKKGARGAFPTPFKTEVALLYDDEALYIGARAHAPNRESILTRRSQRDDGANTDRIIVSLDTYRNRQTAYNFGITAGGSKIDYYQPEDVFEVRDYTFDPVWQARTAVHSLGWSAETRIPFSSLRFHEGERSQVWGINVQRVSPALNLYAFWVVVPGEETGWSSRFGDLVGLDDVRPVRRIALVPYVAGQSVRLDDGSAEDPFIDDDVDWRYGGDLLVDIDSFTSLEATFNPDFGQVEADPAVINLSAYEVFFPEKRPFFQEGAQLLQGRGPRYYYSRRIGAPPHGRAGASIQQVPLDTTIQGAAKLIVRDPSGQSVGAMLARTEEEYARTYDPQSDRFGEQLVEPATLFGVARLQRDFGAGSSIGFVGTGVRRELPATGGLTAALPRHAWAGGVDWGLRFAGQSHVFGGFVGASRVEGTPASMLRLQGSSARYFQRPDADHVSIDPERTSLSGYTGGMSLERIEGAWRWSLGGEARSPGFEINDAGAMATSDDAEAHASTSYSLPLTSSPWQRIDVSASVASGWNFAGVRQYLTPSGELNLVWRNFWQTYAQISHDIPSLSDSLTRGGPLMKTGAAWRTRFGVSTNRARPLFLSLDGSYSTDDLGSEAYGASMAVVARFADRFTFSLTPGYQQTTDTRQYFATLDGGRPETFDSRYVFATLDQRTLYARLRVGLALTSSISLDFYVEPFASVGRYDGFGELEAARSSELRRYGSGETSIERREDGSYAVSDGESRFTLADRDFDVTSLRGNAVLRWDYARGSSLYLVWAQTRAVEDELGSSFRAGDLLDLFEAPARNVFAVKLSYRLNLN